MDEIKKIVDTVLANGDLTRMQSYLSRGRQLASLTDKQLDDRLIASFKTFRSADFDPESRERTENDDVLSEYDLRQRPAPYDLVRADFEAMIDKVKALFDNLDAEDRDRINEEILDDYVTIKRSEN